MIDLFIPYLVGLALGIEPAAQGADVAAQEATTAQVATQADRVPEPQVPTGNFTTAIEVRPILEMTKANWVAVRPYEGEDWLYFTHLLSWRCGLWEIRYGINEAPAETPVRLEPCYEDTTQPNALQNLVAYPIHATFPMGSVDSITVAIVYDDGTEDTARFTRQEILLP